MGRPATEAGRLAHLPPRDQDAWAGAGHAGLLADPMDAPDALPDIVGDQQAAILGGREPDRPAPDLGRVGAGQPEAGHEILVAADRLAVLETDAHHLVAGRLARIPRAVQRD